MDDVSLFPVKKVGIYRTHGAIKKTPNRGNHEKSNSSAN